MRTAQEPERLVSVTEIMVRGEDGRFEQTVPLARGGGASILLVFAECVLDALRAPAAEAGGTFVLVDVETFLAVGSRRLFTWLALNTAPAVDAKAPLPERVPRPPNNTVYKQVDLTMSVCATSAATARTSTGCARTSAKTSAASTGSPPSTSASTVCMRCGQAACCSCGCAGAPRGSCPTAGGCPDAWAPGGGGLTAATSSPPSACNAAVARRALGCGDTAAHRAP